MGWGGRGGVGWDGVGRDGMGGGDLRWDGMGWGEMKRDRMRYIGKGHGGINGLIVESCLRVHVKVWHVDSLHSQDWRRQSSVWSPGAT